MHQWSPAVAVTFERCTKGCGVSWVEFYQEGKNPSKVDTNNVLYRVEEGFFNSCYTPAWKDKIQGDGALTGRLVRQDGRRDFDHLD